MIAFAQQARVTLHALPAPGKPNPEAQQLHVNNVNAYHGRIKKWPAHFRAVATKNLPSYLSWRRMIEARSIKSSLETSIMGAIGLGQ